jgi:hypothetical protein
MIAQQHIPRHTLCARLIFYVNVVEGFLQS